MKRTICLLLIVLVAAAPAFGAATPERTDVVRTGLTIAGGLLGLSFAVLMDPTPAETPLSDRLVVLVPAAAVLLGLCGANPFLVAFLLGAVHPDRNLSLYLTLPMVIGNLPQTVLIACMMPPRGSDRIMR